MKPTYEQAIASLQSSGLRITRPREQLLQLIYNGEGPFSVKMLHERALSAGIDMHLATVHRNLAEFVEMGIINELPGDDNRLYALHSEGESGAHVFCIDCRTLLALKDMDEAEQQAYDGMAQVLMARGFDANTVRMMLAAHCTQKSAEPASKPASPINNKCP
jgi:Fe2+ or Zn2+ uptake regulation protein